MNSPSRSTYEYELTEDELNLILRNVHDELIAHVQDATDPAGVLVAIMADSDQAGALTRERTGSVPRQPVSQRLAAVIEMRRRAAKVHEGLEEVVGRARELAIDLDRELSKHGDLAIAVISAVAFARHRDRHLAQLLNHARDLAIQITYDLVRIRSIDRELAVDRDAEVVKELSSDALGDKTFNEVRELDRALAINRQLAIDGQITDARELSVLLDRARRLSGFRQRWRELDRHTAHDLAIAIDQALICARELASSVTCRLDAFEVDVASADLSSLEIHDPADLVGVIWTDETVWPLEVAEHVGPMSHELTPGIYQVRPKGHRPAASVGRHAVRQLAIPGRLLPSRTARPRAKRTSRVLRG